MLLNTDYLRKSSEMDADPFTDILQLTRAQAVLAGGFRASRPWAIRFPVRENIKMSAILHGSCWFWLEGETEPTRLEAGDAGLLVAHRSHILASDLGVEPIDAVELFEGGNRKLAMIGDGSDFGFIGGHILLDPSNARLLADVLPTWVHIKAGLPEAETLQWLVKRLVEEARANLPGSQIASVHLAQLLFTEILRAHAKSADPMPAGWLKTLADPKAAPALRLMHGDPRRAWGLEELAKACAMSRTTFAGHFKAVSGKAPLTYLTEWRMRLAERALREEATPVALIGRSLGYSSESAFSNAFKRVTGSSPRAFRIAGQRISAGG